MNKRFGEQMVSKVNKKVTTMAVKIGSFILLLTTLLLTGCSLLGKDRNEITVRYDGQEKTFAPSSTWINHSTLAMEGTAWRTQISLANYPMDTSRQSLTVEGAIKSPDQVRVMIMLYGDQGTDDKTPTQVGEYPTKPASEVFHKTANAYVHFFKDGKEKSAIMNIKDWQGKVHITSVTQETISGTVDLAGNGYSIKGSFTARKG
jgi:hypothetical protein